MKMKNSFRTFAALIAALSFMALSCDNPAGDSTPPAPPTLGGVVDIQVSSVTALVVKKGDTLTANTDGIKGGSGTFTFQWEYEDGATTTSITGATSKTYTVVAADGGDKKDEGKHIKVTVTRADIDGSVSSKAVYVEDSSAPALTGTVTITGDKEVGKVLTVSTSGITSTETGTFIYQWIRKASSEVAIGTGSTYTVAAADAGYSLFVRVSRIGNSGSVPSADHAIPITLPSGKVWFFDEPDFTNWDITGTTKVFDSGDHDDGTPTGNEIGTITAAGDFTGAFASIDMLTFMTSAAWKQSLEDEIDGLSLSVGNADAKFFEVELFAAVDGSLLSMSRGDDTISGDTYTMSDISLLYVTHDTTVTFPKQDIELMGMELSLAATTLNLRQGLNTFSTTITVSMSTMKGTLTASTSEPSGVKWYIQQGGD